MSDLESIVPPLELCKQLPEGKFEDSALVWHIGLCSLEPAHVSQRFSPAICAAIYPAPTLAELIDKLTPGEDGCGEITQFGKDKHGWFMMASFEGVDDGYGSGLDTYEEKDQDNPATAALKLWLELNKE